MVVEDMVTVDQLAPEELDSGGVHGGDGSGVREECSFEEARGGGVLRVYRWEHSAWGLAMRHWEVIVRVVCGAMMYGGFGVGNGSILYSKTEFLVRPSCLDQGGLYRLVSLAAGAVGTEGRSKARNFST